MGFEYTIKLISTNYIIITSQWQHLNWNHHGQVRSRNFTTNCFHMRTIYKLSAATTFLYFSSLNLELYSWIIFDWCHISFSCSRPQWVKNHVIGTKNVYFGINNFNRKLVEAISGMISLSLEIPSHNGMPQFLYKHFDSCTKEVMDYGNVAISFHYYHWYFNDFVRQDLHKNCRDVYKQPGPAGVFGDKGYLVSEYEWEMYPYYGNVTYSDAAHKPI